MLQHLKYDHRLALRYKYWSNALLLALQSASLPCICLFLLRQAVFFQECGNLISAPEMVVDFAALGLADSCELDCKHGQHTIIRVTGWHSYSSRYSALWNP